MTVRHPAGFTLVELLVVTVLLGLITLLAAGGIGFGARSWESVRLDAERQEAARLTEGVLRELLTAALPAHVDGPLGADRPQPVFRGSAAALVFAAPVTRGSETPGLHRVRLELGAQAADGTAPLLLRYRRLRPEAERRPWATSVLADRVTDLELRYYGPASDGGEAAWTDRWSDRLALPLLISVQAAGPDLPPAEPLIFAPRAGPEAMCPTPATTAGCRALAAEARS